MPAEPSAAKVSPLIPTLATRIIELVRREGYAVGHRLTELALCDSLGVSRSPVRKALQFLEGKGVVSVAPNKGYQLAKAPEELTGHNFSEASVSEEEMYLRIANDRIRGELADEIAEADLMVRYNLQRLQVQRILNRMARESMIDRKPGRGWIFRPLMSNAESHRESYRFRMIIEPAALLEPGYQVDIQELEKCKREQLDLLDGGIERATPAELYRAGVHFHETMISGAHNRFLLDSLRNINQMRRIVEYGTRLDRSRLHRQCEEHLLLIDLLVKGERMEASNFLRQHLNTARITKVG
ncbi:MAG: GntR family transcriptional regulator [Pseudomonadota bacterium]|jgi:DNA-binding GntR family transcriptional regulator